MVQAASCQGDNFRQAKKEKHTARNPSEIAECQNAISHSFHDLCLVQKLAQTHHKEKFIICQTDPLIAGLSYTRQRQNSLYSHVPRGHWGKFTVQLIHHGWLEFIHSALLVSH